MEKENTKYKKILEILKDSKPGSFDPEILAEKVLQQIHRDKTTFSIKEMLIGFLFGWVYIGWVRRSMVTASVLIIFFFGYQQVVILNRINELAGQKIQSETYVKTNFKPDFSKRKLLFRIKGNELTGKNISVTEKEIDQLVRSVNKLQLKYQDLFYLIENDPQLKKYVEEKMSETCKD